MKVRETSIAGLFEISLDINRDDRGSFREAYQREKLLALGLPDLGVVQWNISTNVSRGTLRGIHAEPWDKYIHVIAGEAYAAIVDLRDDSPTYKQYEQFTLTPENAIFVSRGLGNSYQTLTDDCVYGYLVNQHWSPDAQYTLISYRDPELAIPWPVSPPIVSAKDEGHPSLAERG
ncbi:MAG TPA: dTDP-4-dehydrorhamnose 3,5-epimerase family protein [Acidimicrobiales bacterium]|nr:dTDP-4-dehydrorhamnose 3,5-epimerase family protein [Acidimicrobiales bacterium]